MTYNEEMALHNFDKFLALMDEQIEWLVIEGAKQNICLNLAQPCYDYLEALFDLISKDKDKDEISQLIVVFARFLGENIRALHGGKWSLSLDDEKNVYFNTPVIVGHSPIAGLEFSPIFTMRAYSLRRIKGTLFRAIDAQINHKSLNLIDIME